jgi:hypothetical protein
MSHRAAAWLAWSVWAMCVVLLALTALLDYCYTSPFPNKGITNVYQFFGVPLLVYASVGALVASRRPTNLVGWLLSFLGVVNPESPVEMNIGALPAAYGLIGILYLLGGLLFGIGTLRAGILPRWPAGLLAVAAVLTPAAALLPHAIQRLAAIPVGLALAWLGYALWSERPQHRDLA